MAKKKDNTTTFIIVALAVALIGFILYKGSSKSKVGNGGVTDWSDLPEGCYPLEEVHEVGGSYPDQTWVSIIPHLADGTTSARPPASATSIGSQILIQNTGSALDGTYTIRGIWYDAENEIGSIRVDTPGGYNFNYNATQGGDPRDMTYFGIGHVCIL